MLFQAPVTVEMVESMDGIWKEKLSVVGLTMWLKFYWDQVPLT